MPELRLPSLRGLKPKELSAKDLSELKEFARELTLLEIRKNEHPMAAAQDIFRLARVQDSINAGEATEDNERTLNNTLRALAESFKDRAETILDDAYYQDESDPEHRPVPAEDLGLENFGGGGPGIFAFSHMIRCEDFWNDFAQPQLGDPAGNLEAERGIHQKLSPEIRRYVRRPTETASLQAQWRRALRSEDFCGDLAMHMRQIAVEAQIKNNEKSPIE